jgi:hypothetical protein
MSVSALAMNLSTIVVALNGQLLRRLKLGLKRQKGRASVIVL